MTKLTKSVNTNDDSSQNDNQSMSFSLTKKVEKSNNENNNSEQNNIQNTNNLTVDAQNVKISSAEDIAKWLLGFVGQDVFDQLKNNKYLQLPYTEENITIAQWLEKAIKTIFPQDSLHKIGAQIQRNEDRSSQVTQLANTLQQERGKNEEKYKQYDMKFKELKSKIDEAEDDKHRIKNELSAVIPLDIYINEYFRDPEDTSTELKKLIGLLHDAANSKSADAGKFIMKLSKGWTALKYAFSLLAKDEKENLEIVHKASTKVLSAISGCFIAERRAILDMIAKICSLNFQTYDFISPEETLNVDPDIHNANGVGSSRIVEGITFAVVRRETRKAVKYADIKC